MKPDRRSSLGLTARERETLTRAARSPIAPQGLALRARVVLACDTGGTRAEVARRLGIHPQTVAKWVRRFEDRRLDGLRDAPRSGAPRSIPSGMTEWVLTLTLLSTPHGAARWTTRSLAEICRLSQSTVSRLWRGFGASPSAGRSSDRALQERFRSLGELYLDPPRRARVRILRPDGGVRIQDLLTTAADGAGHDAGGAQLILCGFDRHSEAEAMKWGCDHPQIGLHLAPRGPLWAGMLGGWFRRGVEPGRTSGVAAVRRQLEAVRDPRLGDEGGSSPYTWTPVGRELIRRALDGLR